MRCSDGERAKDHRDAPPARDAALRLTDEENGMRKLLLLGTMAFAFALGAMINGAMANCGKPTPESSPYAALQPQTNARLDSPPISAPTATMHPMKKAH
jgi:hypothetical protein